MNLSPAYQRRSVWNEAFRQFFIDSVVRNYPTQSIFLDVTIDPDRSTEYKVLDGKQRLTSLIQFVNDEFPTPDSLADLSIDHKYYSELPKDVRTNILQYIFTVEIVTNASNAELNEAFDRLNRNVLRLNRQELRHAQYAGRFITKMEELALDPFWEKIGLVTTSRRRRMLDVEYVSEFYLVILRGIQDGKDSLDDAYSEMDAEIPGERAANALFLRTLKFLKGVDEVAPLSNSRFSNVADFYSLWAAVRDIQDSPRVPSIEVASTRLGKFLGELDKQQTERSKRYLLAARQGSNKASNRSLRADILTNALLGKKN
ncbi:DUF262 domain-containing protein [Mycobacterium sp. CSUR Q5927]|nr:DUF262 domain-containing protein [Mycobacterium sp. CSUR Q5927]